MKKYLYKLYRKIFNNRLITPVIEFRPANLTRYINFIKNYYSYKKLAKNEIGNYKIFPILGENTKETSIDPHYFYQSIWAAKKIIENKTKEHVDIGSQVNLIGFLTSVTKVKFVDIRPLAVSISNLENIRGDILNIPSNNTSINSLSCLHVAEHVGLGRYGDKLDPEGTKKACRELARVLAKNGNLYFSLPIGKERVEFNAHRIHSPRTIIDYFNGLKLLEFSAVNDSGKFIENADLNGFDNAKYSCGLFIFTKE